MIGDDSRFKDAANRLLMGLTAISTDGSYQNKEYLSDLEILSQDSHIKSLLPSIIRNCRTVEDFQRVMRGKYEHYRERRNYVKEILQPIFDYLDNLENTNNPFTTKISLNTYGEIIGKGGFGIVYKCHNTLLDCDFAVKLFSPVFVSNEENMEGEKRFFREAKLLFSLTHDNIVRVFDIGYFEGKPYIRMEYVDGDTLQNYIAEKGPVSFKRSLKPITSLLKGMSYAHQKHVIHRDLKPSNVMVTRDGCVKIIDFGISAYLETVGHTRLTRTGETVAGGLYTDPRLIDNPKLRDIRSDIYSIGAIWYYLVVGRAPSGSDMQSMLLESTNVTQREASIILQCMAQDENRRFQSCQELLELIHTKYGNS